MGSKVAKQRVHTDAGGEEMTEEARLAAEAEESRLATEAAKARLEKCAQSAQQTLDISSLKIDEAGALEVASLLPQW